MKTLHWENKFYQTTKRQYFPQINSIEQLQDNRTDKKQHFTKQQEGQQKKEEAKAE